MNLKNLFGAKKAANPLDDGLHARRQHYVFAHRLLPTLTYRLGAMTVMILANPERGAEFLRELWQDAASDVPQGEQIAPDGLQASVTRTEDKIIAIVRLPAANFVTEAHFVAVVSDLVPEPPADDSPAAREAYGALLKETPVQYFTLENGFSLDGAPRTAFCGWARDGAHFNMGDGPEPTEAAFLAFLARKELPPVQGSVHPPRPAPPTH